MTFEEYHNAALETAIYPHQHSITGLLYTVLGTYGEAGEFSEKVKKIIRDHDGKMTQTQYQDIILELGDMLWYVVSVLEELYTLYSASVPEGGARLIKQTLNDVAEANIAKLRDRKNRNVINGEGDHR